MFDFIVFHINSSTVVRFQISSISNCIMPSSFYYISQDSTINPPPLIKTPLGGYPLFTNPLSTPECLFSYPPPPLLFVALPSHQNRHSFLSFFFLFFKTRV